MMTSISVKKVLVGIAATALFASPLFALAGALTDALNNAASGLELYPDSNAVKSAIANAKAAAAYCEKHPTELSKCRGALARAATKLAFLVDPHTKTQYRQPLTTKQKEQIDRLTEAQKKEREELKNAAQQALDALEAEIARLDTILAAKLAAQRAKTAEIEALNRSIEEKQAAGDKNQQYKAVKADISLDDAKKAVADAKTAAENAGYSASDKKVVVKIIGAAKNVDTADKQKGNQKNLAINNLRNAIGLLKQALNATNNEVLKAALQHAIDVIEGAIKNLEQSKPVATVVQLIELSAKAVKTKSGKTGVKYTGTFSGDIKKNVAITAKFYDLKTNKLSATVVFNPKKDCKIGAKAQGIVTCTATVPATVARLKTLNSTVTIVGAKGALIGTVTLKNGLPTSPEIKTSDKPSTIVPADDGNKKVKVPGPGFGDSPYFPGEAPAEFPLPPEKKTETGPGLPGIPSGAGTSASGGETGAAASGDYGTLCSNLGLQRIDSNKVCMSGNLVTCGAGTNLGQSKCTGNGHEEVYCDPGVTGNVSHLSNSPRC